MTERLSPLHVSIHATEGGLRSRMLKNRRGAMSLRWLRALLDHGIEVRAQVVVCPGVNDGDHLDDTSPVSSIAIQRSPRSRWFPRRVPVQPEQSMREHTVAEATEVIDVGERVAVGLSNSGRPVGGAPRGRVLLARWTGVPRYRRLRGVRDA